MDICHRLSSLATLAEHNTSTIIIQIFLQQSKFNFSNYLTSLSKKNMKGIVTAFQLSHQNVNKVKYEWN
jgi:hypothetical protein